MSEDLTIYENLSDNAITFDSKEEFVRYYKQHKEEIDTKPTRGLNLKYQIRGYRIGRKNGSIVLYPTRGGQYEEEEPPAPQKQAPPPREPESSSSEEEEEPPRKSKTKSKKRYRSPSTSSSEEEEPQRSYIRKEKNNQMTVNDKLNNLNARLKKIEQVVQQIIDQL